MFRRERRDVVGISAAIGAGEGGGVAGGLGDGTKASRSWLVDPRKIPLFPCNSLIETVSCQTLLRLSNEKKITLSPANE
jgi:hypothetical protein